MKSQVRIAEGIVGITVELSIQDCIVLKSLVAELKEVEQDQVRNKDFSKSVIHRAVNFIDRVSGEVVSLNEAASELFDDVVDGVAAVDQLRKEEFDWTNQPTRDFSK